MRAVVRAAFCGAFVGLQIMAVLGFCWAASAQGGAGLVQQQDLPALTDSPAAPSPVKPSGPVVPGKPAAARAGAAKSGAATGAKSNKYDPETTAMLLNYCRESLYKIVEFNDRAVLDDEYSKLVNNIDITRIQDDEAAQLIESLLTELNMLKLGEAEKQLITEAYNKKLQTGVLEALFHGKGVDLKGLPLKAQQPATIACKAIVFIATGISSYKSSLSKMQHEVSTRLLQLQADELKRLTVLRTQFFDTEYKLYKRYNLPDRLNLKEVQMAQYIKVLADEDSQRRLERLERLKSDFDAFPPFWYQIGKAAQEVNNRELALEYYVHFERIHPRVFREDLDYVMLCMHRVLLYDFDSEQDKIRRDLVTIEGNTKYYYKWENILFAALTYYQIDDAESGRRLIRTSINEGYEVDMHEQVLREMESESAKSTLAETSQELVEKADVKALEALASVGPARQLDALRAMGKSITGITLSVIPRSHAGQNASYFVPVYNIYSVGRTLIKRDAYNDNVLVHMPSDWFEGGRPKVRLIVKARTFKPSDSVVDKKAGAAVVRFSRVFEQDDIVKKKLEFPLTVRIESKSTTLELEFEAKPVTPQILKLRPELSADAPYFEMKEVGFEKRRFKVENGILVDAP